MINIWKYENKKVKLTDTNGKDHIGYVALVSEAEDTGDPEDNLTLYINGEYYGFLQSEIAEIEEL